jgi:acyl carrier protein
MMSPTIDRLTRVFRTVFDDPHLVICRDTTAADISDWDSLMHVTLIVNVEQEFQVRFSSSEVAQLQSVGDLIDLVAQRQPA